MTYRNESAPGANQGPDQYISTTTKVTSSVEGSHHLLENPASASRIVPQATGVPVVFPEVVTDGGNERQIIILCPYCLRYHRHDWHFSDENIGFRASSCDLGQCYIVATPQGVNR
jgi:hypothetical protein